MNDICFLVASLPLDTRRCTVTFQQSHRLGASRCRRSIEAAIRSQRSLVATPEVPTNSIVPAIRHLMVYYTQYVFDTS